MNSPHIHSLAQNIYTLANSLSTEPHNLNIQKANGQVIINPKSWLSACIFSCSNRKDHTHKLKKFAEREWEGLNRLDRSLFIKENGEVTELFIAVQRLNHCIHNFVPKRGSFTVGSMNWKIITNPNVPEILPIHTISRRKLLIVAQDQPEIVRERRFFQMHDVRRYPGDEEDHGREALSIFLSTQSERMLSSIGKVIETASGFIGCNVQWFQEYHYRNQGETDHQIYATDAPVSYPAIPEPTSYWLGHATLLLHLPLRSSSGKSTCFTLITDPVEGDLNRLLYPRQTKFAIPMEFLPACHLYLLSHNHLDHYEESAIQKLLSQQPAMIVPKGDGYRYLNLGFRNVIELDWWEKQTIELIHDNETYEMKICATPAKHWAGQGPCQGHESTFLGYVIEGVEGGDIYFAGDTARLSEDHINKLRKHFNIRWSFQPGGPDEVRSDMESTHQASVDGLWMHFHLMVKRIYRKGMSKEKFREAALQLKTLYMHTMTFKLGNLHLSDTSNSIQRVLSAVGNPISSTEIKLKAHEKKVFDELCNYADHLVFSNGEILSYSEMANILRATVAVPKIGSRIGLKSPLNETDLYEPI